MLIHVIMVITLSSLLNRLLIYGAFVFKWIKLLFFSYDR